MEAGTTDPSYWLNWRFLVSALYVLGTLISALYLIWKYEGKGRLDDERRNSLQVPVGVLYKDEAWKTCHEGIHSFWLLLFRVICFGVLLTLIVGNTIVDGFAIFYYYTQWTFLLTTIYFRLASAFSLYGFCHNHDRACLSQSTYRNIDAEQGSNGVPKIGGGQDTPLLKNWSNGGEVHARQIAGYMGHLFQIVYQVAAGAVLLTDIVYWLLLYPIKSAGTSKIAVRFPIFRVAYFIVWTGAFVICQWLIHVFISLPWPYPFMDLSPPYSPLWYLAVGVMHVPSYGCFALIVKLKHLWLSRSFTDSYQDLR